jgi:PKD repeat protein
MESNHTRSGRVIGRLAGLRRAGRWAVFGGLALALTACGGGGGGGGGNSNASPTAAFTATPTSGKPPLVVALDGSGSRDSDGTIASYTWSFSDGSPSLTGVTASKTFNTPGNVTVTLTVADNRGATGSATRNITVTPNAVPTATFTATPLTGRAPLLVAFDASGSRDTDGTIASYEWTFGDGGTATGVTPQHTYNAEGAFTATLTVTDNEGGTGTFSRVITVAPPVGSVSVTVKDTNGVGIAGAAVVATVGGASRSATTDASGVALVTEVRVGTGTVDVSRDTFVSKTGTAVTVTANTTTSLDVELVRITRATGGVLTTSSPIAVASPDGRTLEFSIQVVVVDEQSEAITGLLAPAFTLSPCTPNPATPANDCLADTAGVVADAAYTVLGTGAEPSFQEVAGLPPQPYAAALMFDQSESISVNDPTDARLFSAKEFLKTLNGGDVASISAFADGVTAGRLPVMPVTTFPLGNPAFDSNGENFFADLDSLSNLEGGGTPLYEAICRVIDFTVAQAPAGVRRAAVVFTDGQDDPLASTVGYSCKTIEQAIAKTESTGVDIFSIGLSGEVDGLVLATLAEAGNGVFLFADDVTQLIPIYGSLGRLLSGSLTTYRLTYRISTDVAGAFQPGRSVRGTLGVNAATNPINLPFVVRIF